MRVVHQTRNLLNERMSEPDGRFAIKVINDQAYYAKCGWQMLECSRHGAGRSG